MHPPSAGSAPASSLRKRGTQQPTAATQSQNSLCCLFGLPVAPSLLERKLWTDLPSSPISNSSPDSYSLEELRPSLLRFVCLLRLEAITAEKGKHVEQWSDVAGTPISRTERRPRNPDDCSWSAPSYTLDKSSAVRFRVELSLRLKLSALF